MTSGQFDHLPIGSTRLDRIIRDPEHVSPRTGLGGARVDAGRVAEFKLMLEEDLHALPEPVCVESQGSLILADGHHRIAALEELAGQYPGDRRFEFVSVRVTNAPPSQPPVAYAYEIALECSAKGPLPLTRAEKQAAIARLLAETPGRSDREIARMVGVDHKTVGNARRRGTSPPDPSTHPQNGLAATSSPRLARIARQIVCYGDQLGTEGSGVDQVDLVSELATKLRERHPETASMWAEWWRDLFDSVGDALELWE